MWLSVYFLTELVLLVTCIMEISFWGCANDPNLAGTRLRLFFQYWVYLLTAVWIIYGSSFFYDDGIRQCKELTEEAGDEHADQVGKLQWTTLALVVFGYLLIVWILCYICLGCLVFKLYKSWVQMDSETKASLNAQDAQMKR